MGERKAIHPTLLLEAGRLGRAVRQHLLRDAGAAAGVVLQAHAALQLAPNAALLDASATPQDLQAALDGLLSLPALIAHGNAPGPPRLGVYLVADLTEAESPATVRAALRQLEVLLRGRYAPMFPRYREAAAANFHSNAIIVVPAAGEPWAPAARELREHLEQLQREAPAPSPLSNIFVLSQSSGRYLLPRGELAHMIATFLELAIFGGMADSEALERLLRRGSDPYATFVCATAEFDDATARRYCATQTAMELLQWLRHTSAKRTDVERRAQEVEELFDIGRYQQLVPLEKGRAELARVIDSQCPSFAASFRDVRLLEDPDEIRAHYGDTWYAAQRARIERARRELTLFRIEEVIEEVEINGAALVDEERRRVDAFLHDKLGQPSEGNVADAALSLRHLRKRLAAAHDAVQAKATAPLRAPPDLQRFEAAWGRFLSAVAAKPWRSRLAIWGLAAIGLSTCAVALLLRHLAALLGLGPESTLRVALLPPWAWLTAAALAAGTIGTLLALRVWRTTAGIRRFTGHRRRRGELLVVLEDLSRGSDGSLRAYYGSRFERACDIWVHRALLAVLKHVDDRLDELSRLLLALELQADAARGLQRIVGAQLDAAPGASAQGGTAPPPTENPLPALVLRRSLVSPETLARLAAERRKPRELAAVANACFSQLQPLRAWPLRVPPIELEALLEVCEAMFASLAEPSALLQPDLEHEARRQLAAFLADFGQRLDFPLDFAGQDFADDDGVDRSLSAVAITGRPVRDVVAAMVQEHGAGDWELIAIDEPGHRVHLLKLVTDIAPAAIRWHEPAVDGPPPASSAGGDARLIALPASESGRRQGSGDD